jgi:small-conductance mechanosensitive channel
MGDFEWVKWFRENRHDLVLSVFVVLLVTVIERFATRTLCRLQGVGTLPPLQARLMRRGVQWLALAVVAIALFSVFGEGVVLWKYLSAVLAVIGVGFVAQWSFLSNVLAGFIILIWRPFRLGDRVELPPNGPAGRVEDINTMFTVLRADDGSRIVVPNNLFLQGPVKCSTPAAS